MQNRRKIMKLQEFLMQKLARIGKALLADHYDPAYITQLDVMNESAKRLFKKIAASTISKTADQT